MKVTWLTLSAGISIRSVHVGFAVNKETLNSAEKLRNNGDCGEEVSLHKEEPLGIEKLVYDSKLVIRYSNSITQDHKLHAVVPCPAFQISDVSIDFGTCFVGQERSRQISISNPSSSDTWWQALCTDSTELNGADFRVEPGSGYLEAFVTHKARNKVLVNVFFTPRSDASSKASFTFHGRLGEPNHVIELSGSGSYDGKFELK